MQTEIVETGTTALITGDGDSLRENARKFYGQMQTSWYYFAKTLGEIKENYKELSFEEKTFKEFCATEYPSFSYGTIVKMVYIMEAWGTEIEAKLTKDPDYKLPAYESCYTLITAEDKITKPDYSKLRKSVITGKLSYHSLRQKLKDMLDTVKKSAVSEVEANVDELEKELTEDLEETVEEFDTDSDSESVVKSLCTGITARIEWLSENIPFLTQTIENNPDAVGEEVIELAQELEQFSEKLNGFLTKVEEVTNE